MQIRGQTFPMLCLTPPLGRFGPSISLAKGSVVTLLTSPVRSEAKLQPQTHFYALRV